LWKAVSPRAVGGETERWNGMKALYCRDMGMNCNWVGRAESEEELMKQVAQHARETHKMEITPEMAQKARQVMREE
jgi:predicted small metal-binding protein